VQFSKNKDVLGVAGAMDGVKRPKNILIFISRANCPRDKSGGDKQIRTADPLLARQVLSQLSYTPTIY
jgi:hypothetical protein